MGSCNVMGSEGGEVAWGWTMEGLEGQVKGCGFGLDPVGWGPNLGAPWWVFYLVSLEKPGEVAAMAHIPTQHS